MHDAIRTRPMAGATPRNAWLMRICQNIGDSFRTALTSSLLADVASSGIAVFQTDHTACEDKCQEKALQHFKV